MDYIESAANAKIKLAASLQNRRHREKEGLFLVEGVRLAEMAVASAWEIVYALCTDAAAAEPRTKKILTLLDERGCPVFSTREEIYKKASATMSPQGLLLVMRQQKAKLDDLLTEERTPFFVVLDGLQDPGNAGAIIRTADAAGCKGIILLEGTVDLFSDKTVRATMGSMFHMPVVVQANRQETTVFLQSHGIHLLVTALDDTAKQHFAIDYTQPFAVVFGNEGNGASSELLAAAEEKIYIPMYGQAESLNVSTAAAVVLYEAVRQRTQPQ